MTLRIYKTMILPLIDYSPVIYKFTTNANQKISFSKNFAPCYWVIVLWNAQPEDAKALKDSKMIRAAIHRPSL